MIRSASRLLTGPTTEPVTLAEALRHCNVVSTDENDFVTSLITAAREFLEDATSRAYINQTWQIQFSEWPASGVCLPRPPLVEVLSVKYIDPDDVQQTLPTDCYSIDAISQPGRLHWDEDDGRVLPVLDSTSWPVLVTYVAGYGHATPAPGTSSVSSSGAVESDNVPARAKQAILLLVGHWYRVREAVGRVESETALAFDRLVKSLRVGVYP
jgi:uncharacterized phiE125 gp8 family phage protein